MTAGKIDFEDRARASVFRTRLAPITFVLRDFSTTGTAGNSYSLRAASAADERFGWDGTFSMTPFASQGRFAVTNLKATMLWSYLRDALSPWKRCCARCRRRMTHRSPIQRAGSNCW